MLMPQRGCAARPQAEGRVESGLQALCMLALPSHVLVHASVCVTTNNQRLKWIAPKEVSNCSQAPQSLQLHTPLDLFALQGLARLCRTILGTIVTSSPLLYNTRSPCASGNRLPLISCCTPCAL